MEIKRRFDSPDTIQDVAGSSQSCSGQISPLPPSTAQNPVRPAIRRQENVKKVTTSYPLPEFRDF